jgi:protein-disulfide isomerase
MTNDWKLVMKVILGSVFLVVIVIFGLSKMGGDTTKLSADQTLLTEGALFVKENQEVKVNVVIFSDMQCPACARAHELMGGARDIKGVRFVFRHYPLSIHPNAPITARAVEAARLMGKGWEMVDLLFDKQGEWSASSKVDEKLLEYASGLGLNKEVFKEALSSASVSATVQKDLLLGDSLRLSGTPTVYVNGEQVAADFVVSKVNDLLKDN